MFEDLYGLVAGDTRKVVEKLRKGVSSLEIVEQGLDGHPGTTKYRRAPENLGVCQDLAARDGHARQDSAVAKTGEASDSEGTAPLAGCGLTDQALSCGQQRLRGRPSTQCGCQDATNPQLERAVERQLQRLVRPRATHYSGIPENSRDARKTVAISTEFSRSR